MMTSASPVLVPREDPVGKILFAVTVLVFGLVCCVALMTLIAAVLPGLTGRSRRSLERAPGGALLVGLVGYAVLGPLAWYLYSGAFIERLLETEIVRSWLVGGIVVTAVLAAVTFLGAAGTAAYLGGRLDRLHGGGMSELRQTALGALVAVLSSWFPVVGWLVVLPCLLAASFGSVVLGATGGRHRVPAGVPAAARTPNQGG